MSDAASPALASIRNRILRQESAIRDKLDSLIHSQANAKYLQEAIVTMRGGRFVVPVKIENKNAVPGLVHDVSSSGSTLFIEPTAVVEANNAIMQLKAEEQQEIERILSAFTARVASTNFIDIPKSAPTKIQNAAPGPPIEIEIATPAMLPIPIVPERAVARA